MFKEFDFKVHFLSDRSTGKWLMELCRTCDTQLKTLREQP